MFHYQLRTSESIIRSIRSIRRVLRPMVITNFVCKFESTRVFNKEKKAVVYFELIKV